MQSGIVHRKLHQRHIVPPLRQLFDHRAGLAFALLSYSSGAAIAAMINLTVGASSRRSFAMACGAQRLSRW